MLGAQVSARESRSSFVSNTIDGGPVAAQIADMDTTGPPGLTVAGRPEVNPSTSGRGLGSPAHESQSASNPGELSSESERTLSDLLLEVRDGDKEAFRRLYDRSSVAAYSLAVGVIRDRALAADAVQEAFIEIWRNAHTFDPAKGTGWTWILVITHRKSVDLIRRNHRHRPCPHQYQDTEPASQDGAVDQSSLQAETRTHVRKILAELPQSQRQLIELAYFGGYTQSELASKLSLPIGTVKSRTHAALTALKDKAQQSGLTIQDTL